MASEVTKFDPFLGRWATVMKRFFSFGSPSKKKPENIVVPTNETASSTRATRGAPTTPVKERASKGKKTTQRGATVHKDIELLATDEGLLVRPVATNGELSPRSHIWVRWGKDGAVAEQAGEGDASQEWCTVHAIIGILTLFSGM